MSFLLDEKKITCNGIQTRYLEAGERHADQIVFIHGLGSSADRWLDIPLALSLHYHTIAIDLPGFGMAERPESGFGYTIAEYVGYLSQLLPQLGVKKAHLVGHSLGGYIAAEIALRHRELVDRLVLIDTSGMLNGPTDLLKEYYGAAMNRRR